MDVNEALAAIGVIEPKFVIPIHYGTSIETAEGFKIRCNDLYPDVEVQMESLTLF